MFYVYSLRSPFDVKWWKFTFSSRLQHTDNVWSNWKIISPEFHLKPRYWVDFPVLVDLKISLLSWELSSKWGKIVKMQLSFKLNFDKNPNISPQHLTNHDIFYWTHNISPAWLCPPWRSSAWCCGWWRCRRWCGGGGRAWGGTAAETPWSCHEKWNW